MYTSQRFSRSLLFFIFFSDLSHNLNLKIHKDFDMIGIWLYNFTFNNISVILRSILLVEETAEKITDLMQITGKYNKIKIYRINHRQEPNPQSLAVIGSDCQSRSINIAGIPRQIKNCVIRLHDFGFKS